jgi:hypothetical protein
MYLDPSTVPAADASTDLRPLADLVPCEVLTDWHPEDDCPTEYICTPQGEK